MHISQIFGAQFGAYSLKSYLPIISAVVVAAVVGEIAHRAKVKRQRLEQAHRVSKMRQLVRRQRMRRDLALLEAEEHERQELQRRAAIRRQMYQEQAYDPAMWNWVGRVRRPSRLEFSGIEYQHPDEPHEYFDATKGKQPGIPQNVQLRKAAQSQPTETLPKTPIKLKSTATDHDRVENATANIPDAEPSAKSEARWEANGDADT